MVDLIRNVVRDVISVIGRRWKVLVGWLVGRGFVGVVGESGSFMTVVDAVLVVRLVGRGVVGVVGESGSLMAVVDAVLVVLGVVMFSVFLLEVFGVRVTLADLLV